MIGYTAVAGLLLSVDSSSAPAQAPCTLTVTAPDESGVPRTYSACVTEFADHFETPLAFKVDGWHKYQYMGLPANHVGLTTEKAHSSPGAIKSVTGASPAQQKAALARQLLYFPERSHFWMSAWYYIPGGTNLNTLFLFDLESTQYEGNPGRRLMLTESAGSRLMVDAKRVGAHAWPRAPYRPFPTNTWVHLKLHLFLSSGTDGVIELWQDGAEIVHETGQTILPGMVYDWIEVGTTANTTGQAQVVYVDDFVISKSPLP